MTQSVSQVTTASADAGASAFLAARTICRRHAKPFFLATAFLPVAKRNAACATFAFLRLIRQAILPPTSPGAAPPSTVGVACCSTNSIDQTFALFSDRLNDIYEHRLELPLPEFRDESQQVMEAFSRTVHRYQIAKQYFLDWAEGCRMDLTVSRYATWASLEKFCYRTGGVGGLILSCILGASHSGAGGHAVQLGNAARLTNMLANLPTDVARGRIYLPLEDLARFKISQGDLAAGKVTGPFQDLMRFEIARARDLYRWGAEGICWLEADGSRLAASALTVLHAGILGAIERGGGDVFSRRPQLGPTEKMRCMANAWRLSRRNTHRALPAVFSL